MRFDSVPQALAEQNGRKKFLGQFSITTTKGIHTIPTTDESGISVPAGAMLCLQGSVDFLYKLGNAAATSVVTGLAGAHPGIYVVANQQEFTLTHGDGGMNASTWGPDTQIDLVAASTSGVVNVWWVN